LACFTAFTYFISRTKCISYYLLGVGRRYIIIIIVIFSLFLMERQRALMLTVTFKMLITKYKSADLNNYDNGGNNSNNYGCGVSNQKRIHCYSYVVYIAIHVQLTVQQNYGVRICYRVVELRGFFFN